jgi:hypothetical protein
MTIPTCHPFRKHHAKGLCSTCHRRSLDAAKLEAVRKQERAEADRRVRDTRESLTKYVFPERDDRYPEMTYTLLGSKPEHTTYVIALPPRRYDLGMFSTRQEPWHVMEERVVFRPIRKCWEHKGLIVEWYDWEFRG